MSAPSLRRSSSSRFRTRPPRLELPDRAAPAAAVDEEPELGAPHADHLAPLVAEDAEEGLVDVDEAVVGDRAHRHRRGIAVEEPLEFLEGGLLGAEVLRHAEDGGAPVPLAEPDPRLDGHPAAVAGAELEGTAVQLAPEHGIENAGRLVALVGRMQLDDGHAHEVPARVAQAAARGLVRVDHAALRVAHQNDVVHRLEEGPEIRLGDGDPIAEQLLGVRRRDDAGDGPQRLDLRRGPRPMAAAFVEAEEAPHAAFDEEGREDDGADALRFEHAADIVGQGADILDRVDHLPVQDGLPAGNGSVGDVLQVVDLGLDPLGAPLVGVGGGFSVVGIEEQVAAGNAEARAHEREAAVHLNIEAVARDEDEGYLGDGPGFQHAARPSTGGASIRGRPVS